MAGGEKDAKKHNSVTNKRIILQSADPELEVLDVVLLCTLHLLIGIFNKTFSCLEKVFPEVIEWPKRLHIERESYHSLQFEGNECRRLLKRLDTLTDVLTEYGKVEIGHPFLAVLKSFDKLLSLVFDPSVVNNLDALESLISEFRDAWRESNMNVTPKCHIICSHLLDFVRKKGHLEMSRITEQSHEAVHYEFRKTWTRYAVKCPQRPSYGNQLLRAVLDFNGSHAR